MIKKTLATIIGIVALTIVASAQTVTKFQEYAAFNTIDAEYNYNISIRPSEEGNYVVEQTIDAILENYIKAYVKNNTLFISFDEKGYNKDKEAKAAYKGKNAPKPVLNIIVKAPTFQTLKIRDNVVVDALGTTLNSNSFTLEAADNTKINNFSVETGDCKVTVGKNAIVNLNAKAGDLKIKADKNAVLNLNFETKGLDIETGNSAVLTLSGGATSSKIKVEDSSKLTISGNASSMEFTGEDKADVDASKFPVKDATVKMKNSCKLAANVSSDLSIEMDGASLVFSGNPDIKIVNLVKATIGRQ